MLNIDKKNAPRFPLTVCCGKHRYIIISLLFRAAHKSSSEHTILKLTYCISNGEEGTGVPAHVVKIGYIGKLEVYLNQFLTSTLNDQW
jgi:hypothetical protein